MDQIKSILIFTGGEIIGDGLIKLSYLQALRKAYPSAHITWWTSAPTVYTGPLGIVVKKYVNRIFENQSWFQVRKAIGSESFDLIIDTQKKFFPSLLLKLLQPKFLVSSSAKGLFSSYKLPQNLPRHDVERLMALTSLAGPLLKFKREPLEISDHYRKLAQTLLPMGKPYVGFVVGAGQQRKCWPLKRFIELAQKLSSKGYAPVFILGPGELHLKNEIENYVGDALFPLQDLQVVPSVLQTIAIAERLYLAVSNDCGGGHMMAAADIPLVSLFGPTSPDKVRPLVTKGKVIRAQDFGGETMEAIPMENVYSVVLSMLESLSKADCKI